VGFSFLSSFGRVPPLQLLKNWAMEQDCVLCAASGPELVCPACTASLALAPSPEASSVAVFAYTFPLDRLVQRFKSAGDLAVGRWLAERLADRVAGLPAPDLLVAPPLAPRRLRARGFNQSLEIARIVGRRIGVPHAVRGLEKVRETLPQQGLGRRARRRNLRDAFRCSLDLGGRHVVIVDDVLTTGATAAAIAAELRRAGAARVDVWTVAQAPGRGAR
jgi:ComF family protein